MKTKTKENKSSNNDPLSTQKEKSHKKKDALLAIGDLATFLVNLVC